MNTINSNIEEILNAFKNNKTLEYLDTTTDTWLEFKGENDIDLITCFINHFMRVKKEPSYRPYANAEEFVNAAKEHGPYLKNKNNFYCFPHSVSVCLSISINDYNKTIWTFKELLDAGWTWQDGAIVGILENK